LQNELVRDRIVIGINNLELQKRLLTENNLDLPRAKTQCRLSEITDAQFKNMNQSETIVISRHRSNEKVVRDSYRCPKELHSDNGPQYSSAFFQVMELQIRNIQPTSSSFEWFGRQIRPNDKELAQEMQGRQHRHRTGIANGQKNPKMVKSTGETLKISEIHPQKFTNRPHQLAYQLASTCPGLIQIQRKQI
jgi:hypothetical protein